LAGRFIEPETNCGQQRYDDDHAEQESEIFEGQNAPTRGILDFNSIYQKLVAKDSLSSD
jgi:hypothetical protein